MSKNGKYYICNSCGAQSSVWAGKCYSCGLWNTLEETAKVNVSDSKYSEKSKVLNPSLLINVSSQDYSRSKVNYGEVDRVLGGGIVKGAVMLFAGEPGIGKSTLLMQIANKLAQSNKKILYISGEESAYQIGMRAKRLGVTSDNIELATSNITDDIVATILKTKYDLVIVDSIQTLQVEGISSNAGSINQISSSTNLLMSVAKQTDTSIIIVGHVNKEGSIAGPKVLEHIVDAVFQLEGDRYGGFKLLRSVKNRYGSTNESALFTMKDIGLEPVDNPSKALLAERQATDGSIVLATIEGSRPVLVEVQALVNKTNFGYPKRTASGIELNRLNLLVAVLEKRTKLNLGDKDIFINIVGGIKIAEPAADLAICMAIGSATKGLKLSQDAVVFGEVGLAGEVRHVPFIDKRINEAKKLGFYASIGAGNSEDSFHHTVKDVKQTLNDYLRQ